MRLRFAETGDRDDLSSLWAVCFPGDEDFRDYFMAEVFTPANTLVIEDGGRVISMAFILPMEIDYHSNIVPAGYIFAVGTDPAYRGKGLAGDIMVRIFEELRKRDIPLAFLVPQKDGLFEYYKRFEFADVFTLSFDRLVRSKLPQDKILQSYEMIRSNLTESAEANGGAAGETPGDHDITEANELFEKVMKYRNHLTRTPEHWKRAVKIGEIAGGGMFVLKAGGALLGYALCEWVGDDLLINELLAEDEASYNTLCAGVLDRMGAEEATLLAAACPHDAKRFGMARVLDAEKMLGYAAAYRSGMDCAFDLQDKQAPWNDGRYEICEKTVRRGEPAGSKAYITPGQLTEILFGAGPLPYINLLFS